MIDFNSYKSKNQFPNVESRIKSYINPNEKLFKDLKGNAT